MTTRIGAPRPIFYPGDAVRRVKGDKLLRALESAGLDGVLVFKPEAIRYATDFYVKGFRRFLDIEYCLLMDRRGRHALAYSSGSDDYRLPLTSFLEDTRRVSGRVDEWAPVIVDMLTDYGLAAKRVGYDLLPAALDVRLRELAPHLELRSAEAMWEQVSADKHPLEVDCIRRAYDVLAIGIRAGIATVVPKTREIDVAAEIEAAMRRAGNEMTPAITMVASGPNAAIFERVATERVIGERELVILDATAVVNGYTADTARTVLSSGEATAQQQDMYRTVKAALRAAIEAVRPGATCAEIDGAARRSYNASAWSKYGSRWATGHQIGFGLHGAPLVGPGVHEAVKPNMVMCLEPRIHVFDRPESGGVQVEDAVLVTDTGCVVLSSDVPYSEALER